MGYVGFVAHYPDGRVVREGDGVWDEVPAGISRLSLVTGEGRELAALDAQPGGRFFFVNECVASLGRQGVLSAKIIGIVEDRARVHEVRLDLLRGGAVTDRVYPIADLRFSPKALRSAA